MFSERFDGFLDRTLSNLIHDFLSYTTSIDMEVKVSAKIY